MRNSGSSNLFHAVAIGLLLLAMTVESAWAHVSLGEPVAAPGTQYAGHFRIGHGCSGSPTVGIRIEMPSGVTAVEAKAQDGWTLSVERDGAAVKAINWKGGALPSDQRGVFTISMRLPKREGQLLFPVRQICEAGEEYWSEPVPAGGKAGHPAPVLTVTSAAPLAANVSVTGGWFRVLPASVPSGAYFTLLNKSDKSLTLTEVASPACGSLMMHRSVNGGMENVPVLQVAAGETVQFAPGGYHLMCMDAKPVLKPGAQVPVKLRFAGGQVFDAEFAARNAAGK